MKRKQASVLVVSCLLLGAALVAQATVIDVTTGTKIRTISKYIYGLQYVGGDGGYHSALPVATTANISNRVRDLRVTVMRQGGNNATTYNWLNKFASHPDYSNYHYPHDNSLVANVIRKHYQIEAMMTAPMLGQVSKGYNPVAQWETHPGYTNTSAASQIQWMQNLDASLGSSKVRFWCMDNEPMIWSKTHTNIFMSVFGHAQSRYMDYFTRYTNYALGMKQYDPSVKLIGPEEANEWYWYYSRTGTETTNWMEWFIKHTADVEKKSGVRILDVLSFHCYPEMEYPGATDTQRFEYERFLWDPSYNCPWNSGINARLGTSVEKFLVRINGWISQYYAGTPLGDSGSGIRAGLTEVNFGTSGMGGTSGLWYSGLLGTAGREGLYMMTPWLFPVSIQGWTAATNDGRISDEIYYPLYMYTHYFGEQSVDCKVDGSYVSPSLDAFASLSTGSDPENVSGLDRMICLGILNKSSNDATAQIRLDTSDFLSNAQKYVYKAGFGITTNQLSHFTNGMFITFPARTFTMLDIKMASSGGNGAVNTNATLSDVKWSDNPARFGLKNSMEETTLTIRGNYDEVAMEIRDLEGRVQFKQVLKTKPVFKFSWNGKRSDGKLAGTGPYAWVVRADGRLAARGVIVIIR